MNQGTSHTTSPWYKTGNSPKLDVLMDKMHLSQNSFIGMALYFAVGFVSGFIFKRASIYLVILIVIIASILLLQQYGLITIDVHTARLHELLGGYGVPTDNVPALISHWIAANRALALSFAGGFLIGLWAG